MSNLKRKPSAINTPKKKIKITENIENQQTLRENNTEVNVKNLLEESIYKCIECNTVCFNKMAHLMEKHNKQLTSCPHCSKTVSIGDYENHFKKCEEIMLFQCNFCKETFANCEMCCRHSENCINRGNDENKCENSSENNEKQSFNLNKEKIENTNVDNDNYSIIKNFPEKHKMSSSVNINENSTKIVNSTENCEESINTNFCDKFMEQLADDILNDECDSVFQNSETITTFLKVVEKSDLGKILNNENEELLRNIFPIEIESNSDNHETEKEVEPGVSLLSLMQDLINPPKLPEIKHSQELIPLARKKRLYAEKQEKKAKEITFDKLIAMDDRKDLAIEAEIDKIMNNMEIETVLDETSMFDENELLFDEDIYLPDEEINEIMDICNKRNICEINKLYDNVKIKQYTGPKNSIICSTAAQYDCHICGSFSTDQYSEFYTHLSIHNNEICRKEPSQKRGQCLICRVIFPQTMLNNHIKTHIDHIQCNICKEFVLQDTLKCHIEAHSKHHSCNICGEIYESISAVRKHYSHHLKKNTYSCNECSLVFASIEKLVCHISHIHKSIDINYAECIYCFELTDNIKNHIYSTGLCKFKCKGCLDVSETKEDFMKHHLLHILDKESIIAREVQMSNLYRCNMCGLVVNSYSKIKNHIFCHEIDALYDEFVVRKPRATCKICQNVVPKNYLQNHINKHSFYDKCEICNQFVPKSNLQDHLKNHETQFKCKKCEEIFPNKKKLADHQYAHYRLLQRRCNYCHLEFNSEISRVKHMSLIHKNIDSEFVECYYCKELLMVEIEYHILDANYCIRRCKLCNRRFKDATIYKNHVLTDHRKLLENCSSK